MGEGGGLFCKARMDTDHKKEQEAFDLHARNPEHSPSHPAQNGGTKQRRFDGRRPRRAQPVPQSQLRVVGHDVSEPLKNRGMLGSGEAAQVEGYDLRSTGQVRQGQFHPLRDTQIRGPDSMHPSFRKNEPFRNVSQPTLCRGRRSSPRSHMQEFKTSPSAFLRDPAQPSLG